MSTRTLWRVTHGSQVRDMVAGVRVRGGGLLVLQAGQLCLRSGDPGLVERRILRTVRAEVDGGPSRRGTVIYLETRNFPIRDVRDLPKAASFSNLG